MPGFVFCSMKCLLPLVFLAHAAVGAPLILHVATNGNDAASGTPTRRVGDGPLATIEAALRKARSTGSKDGVTILVHEGTHHLAAPIVLTPEDSGTGSATPLIIAASGNEKPILSGGIRLTNWTQIQPGLWQCDARAQLGARWQFRSLFFNGRRATRARTPNEGEWFRMDGARFNDQPFQFKFRAGDIRPAWAAAGDVEIVALEKWTSVRQFIRDVNTTSNVVTLSGGSSSHTRESGAQYFVENASDAIDMPGEWRLDQQTGVVSLRTGGPDPNTMEVIAPRLTELVQFKGDIPGQKVVRHVVLRGLTFADTDAPIAADGYRDTQAAVAVPGDIYGEGMTDCLIEDCTFTRLAGYGVDLGRGCQRNRIVGNQFFDLGAGGVRVGETTVRTEAFDATHSNQITDNQMHRLGRLFPSAVGVFVIQSASNHVAYNHIHDLFYTAISVGWTWGYRESPCHDNVIEFNHLHDIGQGLLSDMGGVYTLGPQPGTVIRSNLIHDVTSFTYGGWGLYTDEGSTGILLEGNIVFRCKSAGFHQHYGKENIVRNNIFAFNRENQLMRSREESHVSFYFTNNIVVFDSGNLLGSTWKNDRFVMEGNLYWDARTNRGPAEMRFSGATREEWKARGHDTNSILADPQFVNAARYDFRAQPGSPAARMGFESISASPRGIRPKSQRN
jgi:parallel beta-helix repeat protein